MSAVDPVRFEPVRRLTMPQAFVHAHKQLLKLSRVRVTFFFVTHPPHPLSLRHDSFRTGTLDPWGHTHRVLPSSDPSFCPCSGCLTCDCQFFQQLADGILPNRSRISFLFTGQPVEGVPVQVHGSGPVCTGRVVLYSSGMGTVPVFGTVRSCMNVLGGVSGVRSRLVSSTGATVPSLFESQLSSLFYTI